MGRWDTTGHSVRNSPWAMLALFTTGQICVYPHFNVSLSCRFWGKDQPNSFDGRNQDCVEFWRRSTRAGNWNDEACNVDEHYLCEM